MSSLTGQGHDAMFVNVDVSDAGQTDNMAKATVDRYGRIDGLINNAAVFQRPAMSRVPFDQVSVEEWDRLMAVNLRGTFLGARAVVPYMKEQEEGQHHQYQFGHGAFRGGQRGPLCGIEGGSDWLHPSAGAGTGALEHQVQRDSTGPDDQRGRAGRGTTGGGPPAYAGSEHQADGVANGLGGDCNLPVLARQRVHDGADAGGGWRGDDAVGISLAGVK